MVLAPAAIRDTVQEFEPKARIAAQGFFAVSARGVYLPQSGSRERDRQLRDWDRLDTLWAWKGARTGLLKRLAGVPWEVTGDDAMQALVDGKTVNAIEHFQSVLQDAHFGQGWSFLVKRFGRDYYAQDFGALFEIIGPGDPDKAIEGAATGIAVLDSLRCFATGNPVWPILYFSHLTNKMHRMHYTRVARFVDTPDGDERLYGSGECALSRYVSIAQQEHLMNRYIESRLDDKPKPGVNVWTNVSPDQRDKAFATLEREQRNDEQAAWGKTVHVHSIDPTHPAKVDSITFSEAPEKFDYNQYTDIHINALALALGVDKQELWELSGGALGSGAQSQILAQKSRGKAIGDFLTMIERFVNLYLLPDGIDFAFKYKDEEELSAQAEQDKAYIEIAEGMKRLSIPSEPVFQMLADKSETFREVLTDESGQIIATEQEGLQPAVPEVTVTDDRTPQTQVPTAQPAPAPMRKVYSFTKAQFVQDWTDLILSGINDDLTRRNFGSSARAQLYRWGKAAFADGLSAGGVEDELDEFDLKQVQDWLYDQSGYVTHFADSLYKEGLPEDQIRARAQLWANKSLDLIYNEGLISADKNGLYRWDLGQTEQHCETCLRMNGQSHRLKEYYKRDILPRSSKLDCGGWRCDCRLVRTSGAAIGRF
jgi:hypothetical protein